MKATILRIIFTSNLNSNSNDNIYANQKIESKKRMRAKHVTAKGNKRITQNRQNNKGKASRKKKQEKAEITKTRKNNKDSGKA